MEYGTPPPNKKSILQLWLLTLYKKDYLLTTTQENVRRGTCCITIALSPARWPQSTQVA